MESKELIERSAAIAGSNAALARALDVPQPHVPMWIAGVRPCPLIHQARMCELIGIDPKEHVWREVRHAMGKHARRVTGALVMLCYAATGHAPCAVSGPTADNV